MTTMDELHAEALELRANEDADVVEQILTKFSDHPAGKVLATLQINRQWSHERMMLARSRDIERRFPERRRNPWDVK